jgi:hypothetical protein
MLRQISAIALLIHSAALPQAWAIDIPIENAGFEQLVLPCAPAMNCVSVSNVPSYQTFRPSTGPVGVFPNGIPEGVNVGSLGNVEAGTGRLVQTLAATFEPNTTYTLNYSVGATRRLSVCRLQCRIVSRFSDAGSGFFAFAAFRHVRYRQIVYSSTAADPALFGQGLGIRLTGNGGGHAEFDRISLDASPTVIFGSASQIAVGGAWKTTLTLFNLAPVQNPIRVAFRGDDGRPLTLPLTIVQRGASQAASASALDRTLEPGATLLVESEAPGSSATLVGWAEIISSGPVAGFAIFRQRSVDGRDAEGTAPLETNRSSRLVLPFDNSAGFVTGVALVNLSAEAVIINATIRDDNGAQIDLQAVALPPMGHTSFSVADRFSITRGRRGIIDFQNTGGGAVAGLGLRFSPLGSFTSIPIALR